MAMGPPGSPQTGRPQLGSPKAEYSLFSAAAIQFE